MVKAWEAAHADRIAHLGGPLAPIWRIDEAGRITDAVNLVKVFIVVRAANPEAVARLFEGHPHMAIFPCDGVEVMPVLRE